MKPNNITTVFRFMEAFIIFLAIISQLPSAVKLTPDYFRESNFSILSPKFMFAIGNTLILILFLRSRVELRNADDLCYEYVKGCDRSVVNSPTSAAAAVVVSERRISRSKSVSVDCRENGKRGELRRSVTEIRKPAVVEKSEESCEDFRRTVEAFIARRQKTLRDEEDL